MISQVISPNHQTVRSACTPALMLINAGYSDFEPPKCEKLVVFHQFSHRAFCVHVKKLLKLTLTFDIVTHFQNFIIKLNFVMPYIHRRMIGPFLRPVFPSYVISPLGLRKKKVPGKFRVIHDLSAPFEGISINSCIHTMDGTVMYDTIDTGIQLGARSHPRQD